MGATSCIQIDDSNGTGPAIIADVNNGRDIMAYYLNNAEVFALMSDGFIRTTTGWAYREAGTGIGDIAVDNDAYTYPLFIAKHDCTIVSCHIAVDSTVTADATKYYTVYLEQTGNDNDLGTMTTAAGMTIHVPAEITITTTSDQDHLAAGESLNMRFIKTGTPDDRLYGVTVHITYTIDQPSATIGTATDNVIRFMNEAGTASQILLDHYSRPFMSVRQNGKEKFHIDVNGKMFGSRMIGQEDYLPPDQYYYQVINTGDLVTAESAAKFSPLFGSPNTVQIDKVWVGSISSVTAASATAFWNIKITDGTNILVDHNLNQYGGTALTKGVFVDMGDINREYSVLSSSDILVAEYVQTGTGPTISGLTFVICYRKLD
jgi:hypothetical protein